MNGRMMIVVAALAANNPIQVTVTPRFGIAPLMVAVAVRVTPTDADTQISVTVDGPLFFRESAWQIGAESPRVYHLDYRDCPPGEYVVSAEIGNGKKVRSRVSTTMTVVGP